MPRGKRTSITQAAQPRVSEYQGRSFIRAPTRLIVLQYALLWLSCTSPMTTIHGLRRVMMVSIT